MHIDRDRLTTAAAIGAICVGIGWSVVGCGNPREVETATEPDQRLERTSERARRVDETYETEIRTGRRLGLLDQQVETPTGSQVVGIECSTCHDGMVREPAGARLTSTTSFHVRSEASHGDLSCNSCHARGDRATLKLADGQTVPFRRTIELCGQCHGPQLRDYRHAAHGGMTGHWDLSRGGRVRNHCVNCHDPHEPAYPTVQPAPGPRDRGLQMQQAQSH